MPQVCESEDVFDISQPKIMTLEQAEVEQAKAELSEGLMQLATDDNNDNECFRF